MLYITFEEKKLEHLEILVFTHSNQVEAKTLQAKNKNDLSHH